jgi:hypothetical protein
LDHEDWILNDDSATLASLGFGVPSHLAQFAKNLLLTRIENEAEVSFFNLELYEAFKANPEVTFVFNLPQNRLIE